MFCDVHEELFEGTPANIENHTNMKNHVSSYSIDSSEGS